MAVVTVDGAEIVVSPTGVRTLSALAAAERGTRPDVAQREVHPAALARLTATGLAVVDTATVVHLPAVGHTDFVVRLTAAGREATRQLAEMEHSDD